MQILKGEILERENVIKSATMHYKGILEFFIALVSISNDLNIDIPIWTLREEKLLENYNEVLIPLKKNFLLKICTQ
ncbi:hypothetical protein IZY60_10435 [Lutibacter sp. B2]|nr:hypothetical protein [Lutibacter sp. B2]